MDNEYVVKNFLGLSLGEQIIMFEKMNKYISKTKDKWLTENFKSVFGNYIEQINEVVYSPLKYYGLYVTPLGKNILMLFKINKSRDFYEEFEKIDSAVGELKTKTLDDNLEYNIGSKSYYPNKPNSSNKSYTNPDRISINDIKIKNDEDLEEFCIGMIHTYKSIDTFYWAASKRIIELYDNVLLDIYGQGIFDYIKSFHHSYELLIIDRIASQIPNETDIDYNKQTLCREQMNESEHPDVIKKEDGTIVSLEPLEFNNLDEELEYVRKQTLKLVTGEISCFQKRKCRINNRGNK